MKYKSNTQTESKQILFNHLKELTPYQFKAFFCLLVHQWANNRFFISDQNLFNLWCELNFLCHEFDESFPDQYDDFEIARSFSKAHPYYFTDKLPADIIAALFTENVDDRIDILANIAKLLSEGIYAAYAYAINALGLNESIDTFVTEAQDHIKYFSQPPAHPITPVVHFLNDYFIFFLFTQDNAQLIVI